LLAGQLVLTRSRPAGDGLQTGCVSELTALTRADMHLGPGHVDVATIVGRRMQLVAKASRGRLTADQSNLSLAIR
jgi:hypothetical protein